MFQWQSLQTIVKVSKSVCDDLVSRKIPLNAGRLLRENDLHIEIAEQIWSQYIRPINKYILSTKLRYFQ